ncbi:HGxxPAAW family protein [Sporichthya polymorpha]|uniref:HGxxPAAW family protein n=1 Tax=Sporichthya polymorpha TaxID=35751 RepID=UPI000374CC78|nr:HGxxPAAW family protein [Sporichthya polymorpha]
MAHGGQGRPISWIAVLVICVGFTVAGVALCMDPTWWLFWTGTGITAAGGIFALAVGIMEDYSTEGH